MSEVDIYKGIAKKQVKQAVLDMYKLAGDNDLYYYEQIQEIIDYIAELEMKIDKAVEELELIGKYVSESEVCTFIAFLESHKKALNILRGNNE